MLGRIDVSVIIVNWNRLDDVLKNLHYFRSTRQRGLRAEVLVIDNGSTDGSAEYLARIRQSIRLIRLTSNVGPAQARNYGIDCWSSGRYIVFVDSDAYLAKSGLAKLVAARGVGSHHRDRRLSRHPDSKRVRPSHGFTRGPRRATSSENSILTDSRPRSRLVRCSSALPCRSLFWGDLFIYNEEVDLSIRVLAAGYRILYSPDVRVYHRVSPSGRIGTGIYWRLQYSQRDLDLLSLLPHPRTNLKYHQICYHLYYQRCVESAPEGLSQRKLRRHCSELTSFVAFR